MCIASGPSSNMCSLRGDQAGVWAKGPALGSPRLAAGFLCPPACPPMLTWSPAGAAGGNSVSSSTSFITSSHCHTPHSGLERSAVASCFWERGSCFQGREAQTQAGNEPPGDHSLAGAGHRTGGRGSMRPGVGRESSSSSSREGCGARNRVWARMKQEMVPVEQWGQGGHQPGLGWWWLWGRSDRSGEPEKS